MSIGVLDYEPSPHMDSSRHLLKIDFMNGQKNEQTVSSRGFGSVDVVLIELNQSK